MVSRKRDDFSQFYKEALKAHLARKPRGATKSWTARKIGRESVSRSLDAIDLARIHDWAMRELGPDAGAATVKGSDNCAISSAALFYVETLAPLEKSRKAEHVKFAQTEKKLERQVDGEKKRQYELIEASFRQKQQVRQLTHQFLLAQEEERKEISRDLHDEIAQVLAGINVRLAALKKIVQLGGEDVRERIDQTQRLVEQSVAAVHRYALRLRPSLLDDLGLIPTLRSYIATLSQNCGLKIQFKSHGETALLGNHECTALYRVAQEALTNVVRHSRAKKAYVSIKRRDQRIRLEIRDDGRGFNAKRIPKTTTLNRLGILGMRERIEMLEGVFSITSSNKGGTSVVAELPFKDRVKATA